MIQPSVPDDDAPLSVAVSQFFHQSPDLLAIFDQQGHFLQINSAWQRQLSLTTADLLHRRLPELAPDGEQAQIERAIAQWSHQQAQSFEMQFQSHQGEVHWLSWQFATDDSGLIYGSARDITELQHQQHEWQRIEQLLQRTKGASELRVAERTAELVSANYRLEQELDERKRIEGYLRVAQVRFAGILDIADDAIIAIDAAQRITLFNQGAEKMFGYAAGEILGQMLDILLPQRFAQSHRQHVTQFDRSGGAARRMAERGEIYGRRRDGSEFPAEASISKLNLGDEKIFTVILRDISDRRQAEESLQRLSRQNQLILNSIGEGLLGLNLDGMVTVVNPAAARLLGYRAADLLNQPVGILLPALKADKSPNSWEQSPIGQALRQGASVQSIDTLFRRRDGSTFPVEYVAVPIQEHGAIVGAVLTFNDVSDRRLVEKMKDEFISVVSHELRTPLTSIHGSLQMLASGLIAADSERGKRLIEIAVDSTNRLTRLVNDILDIERIESGKVTMEMQPCDLADLMKQSADVMQAMADKARVKLLVQPLSVQLNIDPDRIMQTLTNLLSNAIKFSQASSAVKLSATLVTQTTSALPMPHVCIQVKDWGRGIPSDKIDSVFERFQQVDASDSRNYDGTGLGLAICRSIVEQHGGVIGVESVLGEGSTFHICLPLTQLDIAD